MNRGSSTPGQAPSHRDGPDAGRRRFADLLAELRSAHFVGRHRERAAFLELLDPDVPRRVLVVSGPGGIGKTSLLGELGAMARGRDIPVVWLDARDLPQEPAAIEGAVFRGLEGVAGRPGPTVLLLDTAERLAPLEGWLRDQLLPALPASTRVVLAGRWSPGPEWRADPAWSDLLGELPLSGLSALESARYLKGRELVPPARGEVLRFARGSPLALALAADLAQRTGAGELDLEHSPSLVEALVQRLVGTQDPAHLLTLQACAVARHTTEPLLAAMTGTDRPGEEFTWLRGQSFVETGERGLFPHDLVREALFADLRWRDPDRHSRLATRAWSYLMGQLERGEGGSCTQVLMDHAFVLRHLPFFREWYQAETVPTEYVDEPRPADWPALHRLARRQGPETARLLDYWHRRQPGGLWVVRDPRQQPTGFLQALAVDRMSAEDLAADPRAAAYAGYLRAHAPLQAGERAVLYFPMAGDRPSAEAHPTLTPMLHFMNGQVFATPATAHTVLVVPNEPQWAGMGRINNVWPLQDRPLVMDGREFLLCGHDFRAEPPVAWIRSTAIRALREPVSPALEGPALDPEAFGKAVRRALKDFPDDHRLGANPLLRSRLVARGADPGEDPDAAVARLRERLRAAADALARSEATAGLYRALDRAYFHPASKQEVAARMLSISERTYRRRLREAVERVTERLWREESAGR